MCLEINKTEIKDVEIIEIIKYDGKNV